MHRRFIILGLMIAAPALAQPASENDYADAESVLKSQGLPIKGAAVLQVFRDRTPKPTTIDEFKKHLTHLQSSPYVERIKAVADLRKMGPVVRPLLESVLLETKLDAETTGRLRDVLEQFPADKDFAAAAAAARLVHRDKPANGIAVLLDYVPYATDEMVRQEVQKALNVLAKSESAQMLRDTLKDPSGPRRAAAAEAILRSQGLAAKDKIQHLLTDAHPLVRHQIGMTLTEMNDKAGLSILIQSLPDATSERADFALGLLYRAAGDKAPTAPYQGKKNIDVFCAAWNKWYDSHHGTLDLAKQLAQSELGFTLISTGVKANKIYEIGPAKNVHWEFKLPKYAIDVQVVGPNRLLVAEYTDHRVTERDFKGTILWQQAVQFPIAVQRLPNGNTFFATTSRMAIVDRAGKELFTHTPQSPSIRAAQWLRGGQVAYVSSGGRCVLIDAQGRELKAFEMGATVTAVGSNLEVLPNGRILVPLYSQKQVAEFDWDGRKLWWATIQMPISVSRLTNGNTLVTCAVPQRVVELDREGKEVWSLTTDGRPYRARRR